MEGKSWKSLKDPDIIRSKHVKCSALQLRTNRITGRSDHRNDCSDLQGQPSLVEVVAVICLIPMTPDGKNMLISGSIIGSVSTLSRLVILRYGHIAETLGLMSSHSFWRFFANFHQWSWLHLSTRYEEVLMKRGTDDQTAMCRTIGQFKIYIFPNHFNLNAWNGIKHHVNLFFLSISKWCVLMPTPAVIEVLCMVSRAHVSMYQWLNHTFVSWNNLDMLFFFSSS